MDTVKRKTKTSSAVKNRYIAKVYDRINLTLYKGQKEWLIGQIPAAQKSLNGYIQRAIRNQIIADGGDITAWDALAPSGDSDDDTK